MSKKMKKHINSAYRIINILNKAMTQQEGLQNLDVWSNVFEINSNNPSLKINKVTEKLLLLENELNNTKLLMNKAPISKDNYKTALNAVQNVLNSNNLFNKWAQQRPILTREVFNLLDICSQLIPHEEDEITEEEINKILNEIEKLKKTIEEGNFSEQLQAFVIQQINLIEDAIKDYYIIGIRAFKSAFYEAHTILFRDQEIIKTDEGKKITKKIGNIWNLISTFSNKIIKTEKLISAGAKLIDFGDGLLDKIN